LTIGKAGKIVGIKPTTIRYYERRGLIDRPAAGQRSFAGGYRIYAEEHLHRLKFIKEVRHLGFTISEIKAVLNGGASFERRQAVRKLIGERLPRIDERIKGLRELRKTLRSLQERLNLPVVRQLASCCDPVCGPETCMKPRR
jgi:MerR family mercuric resistance operon transcriptional regulator